MARILVTGVAGTGKSTLCKELIARGKPAHDADLIDGLASWVTQDEHFKVCSCKKTSKEWIENHDWLWDREKLQGLLTNQHRIVLCGIGHNQADFYGMFDQIILLKLNDEEELKRLESREGTSAFGCILRVRRIEVTAKILEPDLKGPLIRWIPITLTNSAHSPRASFD